MRKTRDEHAVFATIQEAAKHGRGLRLSPTEAKLLARQPFVHLGAQGLLALEWRTIPGHGRYEISEQGHVRRGMTLLKLTETKSRHFNVTVYSDAGKQWRAGVHNVLALTFLGPAPKDKPFACHKNGRPWDNRPDNIYWGSREDNIEDMKRHTPRFRYRPAQVGESVELNNALDVLLGKSNA